MVDHCSWCENPATNGADGTANGKPISVRACDEHADLFADAVMGAALMAVHRGEDSDA